VKRSALILGATGLVGRQCLSLLLDDDRWTDVVSIGRRQIDKEHAKLRQEVVDFTKLDAYAEQFKVDDIFCCLGTTIKAAGSQEAFRRVDYVYPFTAAALGKAQGAQQFLIITSMGADPGSMFFYNRVKGDIERSLRELDYPSLQIFRPSLILGNRSESRAGESIGVVMMKLFGFAMVGPLRKYRAIEARDVARGMVEIARQSPSGANVYASDRIQAIADQHGT
jgi:uncharacterized protein YbjT (DUF2867 family)